MSVSSVKSTSIASAVTSINAPAPILRVTSAATPPPVKPLPAVTEVISPLPIPKP